MSQSKSLESKLKQVFDAVQPFWIGGLSGMLATSVVQPIDMIKTVIQIKSEAMGKHHEGQKANFMTAFKDIFSKEGIRGFYRG
jgi:hypothetical protein